MYYFFVWNEDYSFNTKIVEDEINGNILFSKNVGIDIFIKYYKYFFNHYKKNKIIISFIKEYLN